MPLLGASIAGLVAALSRSGEDSSRVPVDGEESVVETVGDAIGFECVLAEPLANGVEVRVRVEAEDASGSTGRIDIEAPM
jgi:hypothetical protein